MTEVTKSRLKRPVYEMPAFIREALQEHNLEQAYAARPAYQRNDYVGWISRAKQEPTREKRLNQMLSELRAGTHYMNMPYKVKPAK